MPIQTIKYNTSILNTIITYSEKVERVSSVKIKEKNKHIKCK